MEKSRFLGFRLTAVDMQKLEMISTELDMGLSASLRHLIDVHYRALRPSIENRVVANLGAKKEKQAA
jgi:hypothetical protein